MDKPKYFIKDGKRQYYLILKDGTRRLGLLVRCENCGKRFVKPTDEVKRTKLHFCSVACKKFGKVVQCYHCGKAVYRNSWALKTYKVHFCSVSCRQLARKTNPVLGKKNYFGQSGLSSNPSRLLAIKYYGPPKCEHCGYAEHDPLIESHHIDKDRKNNSKENLIWLCRMCHGAIHLNLAYLEDRKLVFY